MIFLMQTACEKYDNFPDKLKIIKSDYYDTTRWKIPRLIYRGNNSSRRFGNTGIICYGFLKELISRGENYCKTFSVGVYQLQLSTGITSKKINEKHSDSDTLFNFAFNIISSPIRINFIEKVVVNRYLTRIGYFI